jgi:hypothetical protein
MDRCNLGSTTLSDYAGSNTSYLNEFELLFIHSYKSVIGLYLGTNAFITNQAIK